MISAWIVVAPSIALAAPCTDEELTRIIAPVDGDDSLARVECDVDLTPLMTAAITRTLVFSGAASSGTSLDCHGGALGSAHAPATILIVSERIGSSSIEGLGIWDPVTDVTIRDCEIHGNVRIQGMGTGRWTDEATRSSHVPFGHVARVREAAPRRITFEDVTFVGLGGIPLYVSIGVQDTTVVRSYFTGRSNSTALYMDAESRGATIRDCVFDTETRREVIALDSSEENRFIANWISNLDRGGIYLYRNCGERSMVRFTPSQRNEIINNVFYYERYRGPYPGVFFGADDGFSTHRFCHQDLDYPYGSGADDRDYTRWNAVMQNQIYSRSPGEVLHTEWPVTNVPNHVEGNTTVTSAISRPSGCFVRDAHVPRFVPHGESVRLSTDGYGRPFESPVDVTCVDGDLDYASTPTLRPAREIAFACSRSSHNAGCRGEIVCPDGGTLAGARAACNLEWGSVTDAHLASVPRDMIQVVRTSDVGLEGRCWVGEEGTSGGELSILGTLGGSSAGFGCREHDRNGGDCEIRGIAHCVDP
ncbi:hypothetical protein DB32_007066 [Sandaracinus amylolyticus]|uniref:Right handed beta helix domain-containing protein n=1 Tax=Sandaracinus amylolyticus TaxID=927083 RepID=A0A0F6W886_9BACT|nr:hypothetical protein DB32_007066 [Sandaracinus amylolyticus]